MREAEEKFSDVSIDADSTPNLMYKKENRRAKNKNKRMGHRRMEDKLAQEIYKNKSDIKEETWMDNTEKSAIKNKARTRTLDLNWRKKCQGKDEKCLSCEKEEETFEQFLLTCSEYGAIRN